MRTDYDSLINAYYPAGTRLRDIYLQHSQSVSALACHIARRKHLAIDEDWLTGACMLHDIGIFLTDAPGIECNGHNPYLQHGMLGAQIIRQHNFPEPWARIAERHTGAGITASEIIQQGLPLPPHDIMPQTLMERLVCYADKFFSKSGHQSIKSLQSVRTQMAKFGPDVLFRFDDLHRQFG